MSLTRVSFSLDDVTYYSVPINPLEANLQDSDEVTNVESVDGASTQQRAFFDLRPRTFTWRNLPQKEPYITMVNTLKSYAGIGDMYIKLNTINFGSTDAIKIKVVNVATSVRPGAGPSSSAYKMSWAEIKVDWVKVLV